ncbi:MAG: hypothetical protein OXI90_05305 [Gammaproteobacteria bacterium]|nr:hypothetical protein [Gammaproteobacteria bacterium]
MKSIPTSRLVRELRQAYTPRRRKLRTTPRLEGNVVSIHAKRIVSVVMRTTVHAAKDEHLATTHLELYDPPAIDVDASSNPFLQKPIKEIYDLPA